LPNIANLALLDLSGIGLQKLVRHGAVLENG
jgi:hypothetical protein